MPDEPTPTPRYRRRRWPWLVGGLALAAVAACCYGIVSQGRDRELGGYVAPNDLCHLTGIEAFNISDAGATRQTVTSDYTIASCAATTRDEDGRLSIVATVRPVCLGGCTPAVSDYRKQVEVPDLTHPITYNTISGLGTEAAWYWDGREAGLIGYDDNLNFSIEWRAAAEVEQGPPDLIARLYRIAGSLLIASRREGLPPPATIAAELAPPLPTPSPEPRLEFGPVEDFCSLVDFGGLGPFGPDNPLSHENEVSTYGTVVIMTCSIRLPGRDLPLLFVSARVYENNRDPRLSFEAALADADNPIPIPGFQTPISDGYFEYDDPFSGQLVMYRSNLLLQVFYARVAGPVPDSLQSDLEDTADSVVAALRVP